jgi:hypothetical protein
VTFGQGSQLPAGGDHLRPDRFLKMILHGFRFLRPVVSCLGDERAHSHVSPDDHHRLEIGEVRLALDRVRMNQVRVDTQAVEVEAGLPVGPGDLLATIGTQAGEITAAVVAPKLAVGLAEE